MHAVGCRRGHPGSGTGHVCGTWPEADFPGRGVPAGSARREGRLVSSLCPGEADCAGSLAPPGSSEREAYLGAGGGGAPTGQHSAGRVTCLSSGLAPCVGRLQLAASDRGPPRQPGPCGNTPLPVLRWPHVGTQPPPPPGPAGPVWGYPPAPILCQPHVGTPVLCWPPLWFRASGTAPATPSEPLHSFPKELFISSPSTVNFF